MMKKETIAAVALLALCASCGHQDTAPVAEVAAPIVSVAGAREFAVGQVRFTMVPVEGGTFMMGATAEQQPLALEREYPPHRVTVSDYWLGQTPVTQGLWLAVMGHNPSEFSREKGHGDWATRPVEMVSYNDCLVFIARLDSITGEPFRLPTEAEWEYAARGGNRSMHYRFAGGNDADSVAWQSLKKGTPAFGTHPVGTKAPNELGLYDMSGNVWEWCSDLYGPYSAADAVNPTGAATGTDRVYRGGCWSDWHENNSRVTCRHFNRPDTMYLCLGLRLAL